MPATPPVRIALIDDHELIRDLVGGLVEKDERYKVVVRAKHGREYVERCSEVGHVDVALVDLQMPVMDGFALLAWMSKNQPRTKAITLTVMADDWDVRRALECGARGFLYKGLTSHDLYAAIDDVHVRGFHYNELVGRDLRNRVRTDVRKRTAPDKLALLAPRELEFLLHWVDTRWRSLAEVAELMGVKESTAETYRKEVGSKTGCPSRHALVDFAWLCSLRAHTQRVAAKGWLAHGSGASGTLAG